MGKTNQIFSFRAVVTHPPKFISWLKASLTLTKASKVFNGVISE
jgi:hypothetical protein